MRIRSLSIHGFKSFADRTVVTFGDGVSCVVGSNGCGKSNVFDAVKWCVGEQSAKRLRGEKMEDVIFAGSVTRAPVGYAEVVVTFEGDKDAPLPGEWADKTEISVGRRLNREGSSDYLINDKRVRRKEIIDLFRDTGVGTSSYSFIEQGRVEEIIHAKPEQRRAIFDEAAGITKYKARRKEAMSRLEATATQLDRAADVSDEMGSRLAKLERQVLKAAQFRRLRELVRQEEIFLALARYADQSSERSAVRKLRREAKRTADTAVSEVARKEHDLVTRREEVDTVRAVVQQWRDEVAELDGQRREESAALGFLRRTVDETREEIARVQTESSTLKTAFDAMQTERVAGDDGAKHEGDVSVEEMDRYESEIANVKVSLASIESSVTGQQEQMLEVQRKLGVAQARTLSVVADIERVQEAVNTENKALRELTAAYRNKPEVAVTKLALLKAQEADLTAMRVRLRSQMSQIIAKEGSETQQTQKQLEMRRAQEATRYESRVEQERARLKHAFAVTMNELEFEFEEWENASHDEMRHFERESASQMEQSLVALSETLRNAQVSGEQEIAAVRERLESEIHDENTRIDEQINLRTLAADERFAEHVAQHQAAQSALAQTQTSLDALRKTLAEKIGMLAGQEQQLASTLSDVDPEIGLILEDTRCLMERIPNGSLSEVEVARLGSRALLPVVTSLDTLSALQEVGRPARLLWLPCADDKALVVAAQQLARVGGASDSLIDAITERKNKRGDWVTPSGTIGQDGVLCLGENGTAVTVSRLQGSIQVLTQEVTLLRAQETAEQKVVMAANAALIDAKKQLEEARTTRREEERVLQTWSFEERARAQEVADEQIDTVKSEVARKTSVAATALEIAQSSAYDALQQSILGRQQALSETREKWRRRLASAREEADLKLVRGIAEVQRVARREWDDVLSEIAHAEFTAADKREVKRVAEATAVQALERASDLMRERVRLLAEKVTLMRNHMKSLADKEAQSATLVTQQKVTKGLLDETSTERGELEKSLAKALDDRAGVMENLHRLEQIVVHLRAKKALNARFVVAKESLKEAEEERGTREKRVASLDEQYNEAYARFVKDRDRAAALDEACRNAETDLRATLGKREEAVSQFDKLTSRFEVLRTEVEHLRQDMQDRHDISLSGTLDRLDMLGVARLEPTSATESTVVGDKTVAGVEAMVVSREQISQISHVKAVLAKNEEHRASLGRLGEVNLLALDEYNDVAVRHEDLLVQRHDLEDAVTRIRAAIAKMNRTCRQMFREAFDDIHEHFSEIYPRLVGGGSARLALTNEEDLLETGVEIYVQPPGKRSQNLTLLSGGEKAMAAISLLMSMFKVRPSPFCLMDEVDAPLDEANGSRFNEMLKEMSKVSQFILITHNRKTMESADTLYGVTMVEPGTSRVVSVQLSETV